MPVRHTDDPNLNPNPITPTQLNQSVPDYSETLVYNGPIKLAYRGMAGSPGARTMAPVSGSKESHRVAFGTRLSRFRRTSVTRMKL
jgi:hypothetical protein